MSAYRFRTRPYRHQYQAVKFCLSKFRQGENPALLMEPRTGKTKVSIDVVGCLFQQRQLRKVLIVCPNRVMGTWAREIHTHFPFMGHIHIWDAKARKLPIPDRQGDVQFLVVNFEAFSTPGRRTASGRRSKTSGRHKVKTQLTTWLGGDEALAIVDESHKIKSPSGKASAMIVSLRDQFQYRMILTGTPITKAKRIHDVYMQWKFLNPHRFDNVGRTVEAFRNATGRWISANGFPQWIGPREAGVAKVQQGLHEDAFIVTREDCFDLPPRDVRLVSVPLKESAKYYDEMAETMITQIKEGVIAEASIALVVALRLMQITSGHVGVERAVGGKSKTVSYRVGREKLDALKEILVEEVIDQEQKVVIAARFVPDLNMIASLCRELKIPNWAIRGGVKRQETDDAIQAFKLHTDGPGAMIIQPAAASLGIDLSTANHMIWYSLTQSWVDYTQACDRIALSKRSTLFTYLQCPDTVDAVVYDSLVLDGEVAKAILARPECLRRTS